MRIRLLLLAITAIAMSSHSQAQAQKQEKLNIKFGKITPQDFDLSASKFDTSAAAVVIADIGSSSYELTMHSDRTIVYTRLRRIKILKKSGFEAADIEIPYYFSRTGEERINELKASTYNLENGKVVETKVDSKSIFKDKLDDHNLVKKFTFPALKEGSIIEYTYTTTSDFYTDLRGWSFQCEYPILWSEYNIAIPEIYNYVFLSQGSQSFDIATRDAKNADFQVTYSNGAVSYVVINMNRWVKKNVPALKPEKFTSTIRNYVSKIEFELSSIQYPMEAPRNMMGSWQSMKKGLLESDAFGASLSKSNGFLDDVLKPVTQGSKNDLEKAKKIYSYVRDNFVCNDHTALGMGNSFKDVLKTKTGSVAELNLLLTAMLRHEKIKADPIILSTRSHGLTNETYPIIDRFNYVIVEAQIDGTVYQMDASNPLLGFNHLDPECYNGHARIVNDEMDAIYLSPDSLKEKKVTLVTAKTDGKGALHGSYTSMLGYIESYEVRDRIKQKGADDYFKVIQSSYNGDAEINQKGIDSLKQLDEPIQIRYEFELNKGNEDIIYFNPMLNEGLKENYFASAERSYPVEMPCSASELYVLNLEIPTGYEVEELPKSAQVSLNDDEGTFQYLIGRNENMIQFKSVIKLNKATFAPEDYNSLRDFFAMVVKKQSEQIVFKKKK